jgi:TonB family protein
MSAQDKKIIRTVAYSAGAAVLVHVAVALFFAALLHAGYFNAPPPKEEAEQFEITFEEDPFIEPELVPMEPQLMAVRGQEPPKASNFFNTDGLKEAAVPNENATFYSDKNTQAASEAPAEEGSTSPMPTITEGVERDLPSKDLFRQSYSEGPGQVPAPNSEPSPPSPGMAAEETPPPAPAPEPEPVLQPTPPTPEPVVAETPPEPPAPTPPPVVAEAPPEPPAPAPAPVVAEAPPEPAPAPTPPPAPAPVLAEAAPNPPPAPVMPEATLPPVPQMSAIAEPEDKTPDPATLVVAEEPKEEAPTPKKRKDEPETGSSKPLPPDLAPGEFKPDPKVMALLDMTKKEDPLPKPPPAPAPQFAETPPKPREPQPATPEKTSVDDLLEGQRRRASTASASGYQAERTPTRIKGGVSNKGPNSVDSKATPLGRYQSVVSSAVERTWYAYTKRGAQNFTIGTAKIRFAIEKSGAVSRAEVVNNSSNMLFETNCIRAIQDAKFPPIPEDIDHLLFEGKLEVEYTFSIY